MGILDSIVEWIATQIMNLLDLVTGSVLGALGCDMSTFLRYFPAAETLYEVFVAIAVGFILLNLVWQLFKNFGLGVGLSAEDPTKLAIKSILFIFLALFADQIMVLILGIAGTPYDWVVDTALPPIEFSNFGSVLTVIVGCLTSGSVSLIVLILVIIIAWNYIKLLFEAAERYILVGVLVYARTVRNIIDQVLLNQNLRTEDVEGDNTIIADDVDDYLADEGIDLKKASKGRIGFV